MSNDTKDYAGGWITEKKGTDVPPFLKLAFPVIGLSCIAYIVIYMNGEIGHAERGPLVRQLNAATGASDTFMYIVAALAAAFVVTVLAFTYSKPHGD
uniref:Uncharacterized protein n=1 Tax=Solibacter usitatus (strain Ellin6076) TaxID=234267 RepID=Q021A7_SOLUE